MRENMDQKNSEYGHTLFRQCILRHLHTLKGLLSCEIIFNFKKRKCSYSLLIAWWCIRWKSIDLKASFPCLFHHSSLSNRTQSCLRCLSYLHPYQWSLMILDIWWCKKISVAFLTYFWNSLLVILDLGSVSVLLYQIVWGRIKCTRGELSKFLQIGEGGREREEGCF